MEKLKLLAELVSFRDIRNAIFGTLIIICGLLLAFLTLWANKTGNLRLASIFALISLVFVIVILVFVVPPLARSASAEASQLDLPFEFTVGGAFFLGILMIVGFAAWNTGNNLLFLVLSILISTFAVSFSMGNACLKKLDVKMRFPETAFAQRATPITVTLSNRKRLFPCISVNAEVRGLDRKQSVLAEELSKVFPKKWVEKFIRPPIQRHKLGYFVHIPRLSSVQIEINHTFQQRGRFIIKDFELSTGFPFGFFRHRKRLLAEEVEIIIFPKIESVQPEFLGLAVESGKIEKLQRGTGSDLLSLRDYQPHDDLRYVDWKATAKTKRLIVRDLAAEDRKSVQIIFDQRFFVSSEQRKRFIKHLILEEQKQKRFSPISTRFEEAVSRAASLLYHLDHDQVETRLILNEYISPFGVGKAHLYSLLKKLALVEPKLIETVEELSFPSEVIEEISSESSHSIFITFIEEKDLPREIKLNAKVIKF